MKMAMPSAIGVARSSARSEEYSVPQMNGSAPNSPATGSHVFRVQKLRPNFAIESVDCRDSSNASPTTISTTSAATAPVRRRKRSLKAGPGAGGAGGGVSQRCPPPPPRVRRGGGGAEARPRLFLHVGQKEAGALGY